MFKIFYAEKDTTLYESNLYANSGLNSVLEVGKSLNTDDTISSINSLLKFNVTEISQSLALYNKSVTDMNAFMPPALPAIKNKKALLVGIRYLNTETMLDGCWNDIMNYKDNLLIPLGFSSTNIKIMADSISLAYNPDKKVSMTPTRANILREFTLLLSESKAGDLLFFGYSGHGFWRYDTSNDETDNRDESLDVLDDEIFDDEIYNLIKTKLHHKATLILIFDSCHSGTVCDLRCRYSQNTSEVYRELSSAPVGNVFMLSGSRDNQTSADDIVNGKAGGGLTNAFFKVYNEKKTSSWKEILVNVRYELVSTEYTQVPQLSTGKIQNIDLPAFIW
jgi:hypothetical protein